MLLRLALLALGVHNFVYFVKVEFGDKGVLAFPEYLWSIYKRWEVSKQVCVCHAQMCGRFTNAH